MSGRNTWACSLSYGPFAGEDNDRLTKSEPGCYSRQKKTSEKLVRNPDPSNRHETNISKMNTGSLTGHLPKSTKKDTVSKDTYRDVKDPDKPSGFHLARKSNAAYSAEKNSTQTVTGKFSEKVSKAQSGSTKEEPTRNDTRKHNPSPKSDSKSRQSKSFVTQRESSGYGSQENGYQAKSDKYPRSGHVGENSSHKKPGSSHDGRLGSKTRSDDNPQINLQVQQEARDSTKNEEKRKVYKDNSLNRRLIRVGLPIGNAVYHKATGTVTKEEYVNSWKNRASGRVGLPRGSKPDRKNHPTTKVIQKLIKGEEIDDSSLADVEYRGLNHDLPSIKQYAKQQAICIRNRAQEEQALLSKRKTISTRSDSIPFRGNEIPFEELTLYKKIGEGGFGEVHIAVWKNTIVAVKRLRVGGVSTRRSQQFLDEIKKCCSLQHANIVRFIGACLEKPNLSIVMEYMQMSLFEAFYIKPMNLQENQRISIIQQILTGLKYLHGMKTAHCDLKPQNILLSLEADKTCIAKITDFGLSMVRENSITTSDIERAKHIGTPRYSAPEVLRGEMLGASEMMKADIYSISLVSFEIIYEDEPFYNFRFSQLQKQVGKMGYQPEKPEDPQVNKQIVDLVYKGLAFNASSRPVISEIEKQWKIFSSLS